MLDWFLWFLSATAIERSIFGLKKKKKKKRDSVDDELEFDGDLRKFLEEEARKAQGYTNRDGFIVPPENRVHKAGAAEDRDDQASVPEPPRFVGPAAQVVTEQEAMRVKADALSAEIQAMKAYHNAKRQAQEDAKRERRVGTSVERVAKQKPPRRHSKGPGKKQMEQSFEGVVDQRSMWAGAGGGRSGCRGGA